MKVLIEAAWVKLREGLVLRFIDQEYFLVLAHIREKNQS